MKNQDKIGSHKQGAENKNMNAREKRQLINRQKKAQASHNALFINGKLPLGLGVSGAKEDEPVPEDIELYAPWKHNKDKAAISKSKQDRWTLRNIDKDQLAIGPYTVHLGFISYSSIKALKSFLPEADGKLLKQRKLSRLNRANKSSTEVSNKT